MKPIFTPRTLSKIITAAAVYLLAIPACMAMSDTPLWQISQLNQPESVVADPSGKWLYISNINGHPTELNAKGYISKVSRDGKVIDKHWVVGLDAPKGIAIKEGKLYIADMQTLHVINVEDGSLLQQFKAPQAEMLNDVTVADDGTVYISDLLGGSIYRLKQSQLLPWFTDPELAHPNGLLWRQGELLVANWGTGLNDDFTTQTPGSLYRLNITTKTLAVVPGGYQLGNLDGIVVDGDNILVSDWITGTLYQLTGNERCTRMQLEPGLADIGSTNGILYTPMMQSNTLSAWQLR